MSSRRILGAAAPPLHVFVRRQQVLRMFRALMRGAADLSDKSLTSHVREQIRFEFRNNSKITDNVALRNLIQDGQRQLTKLQSMGTKAAHQLAHASPLPVSNSGSGSGSGSGSSWLNEQDREDQRGRMGAKWPWEKN